MSKYQSWKWFEHEIVRALRALGLVDAKRNWDEQFEDGCGYDIRAGNYVFQLKYGKKPNLKRAWDEANNSRDSKEVAVGICRFKEEKNTLAVMAWKDLKNLISLQSQAGVSYHSEMMELDRKTGKLLVTKIMQEE